MDVMSDLIQVLNLYKNCHNWLCLGSIGIVMSSYWTTSLYVKFVEGLKWSKALIYPSIFGYASTPRKTFYLSKFKNDILQRKVMGTYCQFLEGYDQGKRYS